MGEKTSKKKLFLVITIAAVVCVVIAAFFIIRKYTPLPTEEEFINFNSLENILQKKESLYIQQKNILEGQEEKVVQICYYEYADGQINMYNWMVGNPIEDLLYNGFHYRIYQDRVYAVCEKSAQSFSAMLEIFSNYARYPDSAGTERPKPQKLERNGDEYLLSYSWKTYYDTNINTHDLSFRFAKDWSCKEIKLVEDDMTTIYSFEYGNKKSYFDIAKNMKQTEYIEIDVTNVSEPKRSFGPCKIPLDMYVWIEHITQAELYTDSACTQFYQAAVPVGPNAWITEEPVVQDLSLYLRETYE